MLYRFPVINPSLDHRGVDLRWAVGVPIVIGATLVVGAIYYRREKSSHDDVSLGGEDLAVNPTTGVTTPLVPTSQQGWNFDFSWFRKTADIRNTDTQQ